MECGECTLCCFLLPIKWLDKPENTPCIHCDKGCLIHETKDFECSNFECSWLQSGVRNDALRPDKCGIIFEMMDENTFYGTINPETGITEMARKQLNDFSRQGYTIRLSQAV